MWICWITGSIGYEGIYVAQSGLRSGLRCVFNAELLQYTGVTKFGEPRWQYVGYAKLSGEDLNYFGIQGLRIAGNQGIAIIAICQVSWSSWLTRALQTSSVCVYLFRGLTYWHDSRQFLCTNPTPKAKFKICGCGEWGAGRGYGRGEGRLFGFPTLTAELFCLWQGLSTSMCRKSSLQARIG